MQVETRAPSPDHWLRSRTDRVFLTEVIMFTCSVCGAGDSREELVEEVFRIDGK